MNEIVPYLPHLNAALNSLAGLLLMWGYVLIKRGKVRAHRNVMLAAFGVSVVFLASYLTYHYFAGSKHFPTEYGAAIRSVYLVILATHVVLAAAVPFLAVWTIYLGLSDQRPAQPLGLVDLSIWLYVSVTGVIVYAMLYHLYPGTAAAF